MKTLKLSSFTIVLLTAMLLIQGCALLLVGGVAAGVAYGTVKHVNNTLLVTDEVSLDQAWTAANAALKQLEMPVTSSKKDGAAGRLEARNAQDQPVIIQMLRKTDRVTELKISVGTFDSLENRIGSQQIYDQIKRRF